MFALLLFSCSVQKKIGRAAKTTIVESEALKTAHVGISIFEPAANKYWYNYQGDHYFVPASNVKIATCFAAMKYLGDSIVGLRYGIGEEKWFKENVVVIESTGDPTLLHKNFSSQPVFDFLRTTFLTNRKRLGLLLKPHKIERWGDGWSWDDYQEPYMVERNSFPIFGNVVSVSLHDTGPRFVENPTYVYRTIPRLFTTRVHYFDSLLNKSHVPIGHGELKKLYPKLKITRAINTNGFRVEESDVDFKGTEIPFVTNDFYTAVQLLMDTFKTKFAIVESDTTSKQYSWLSDEGDISYFHINKWNSIHSHPTDSVLRPMMHQSDNFLAEQSLLMVSNEVLGAMSDTKIIDTILKTDFKELPQKPRWVDGSGLSRYNLFSPQDFVAILDKMKNEFGMERIKRLFPLTGMGFLKSYNSGDSAYVFAKTGTLSGVVALSGFLYTRKAKLLLFSILVNNHQASATAVRRTIETFLQDIRRQY